jgi:hypothetical protein
MICMTGLVMLSAGMYMKLAEKLWMRTRGAKQET